MAATAVAVAHQGPSRSRHAVPIAQLYLGICLVVLFAPIAVLVLFSFNAGDSISLPFKGFSTRWYEAVLADPDARQAFANSVLIAALVTPTSVALGLVSAYAVARLAGPWRGISLALFSIPLVVPWLVIGIAALLFFTALGVGLSTATVVVMQTVVTFPLVTIVLYGRLIGMDVAIEEVGLDLGATRIAVLRLIVLPQLVTPLLLGAIFAFISSLGNFVVTFFVSGFDLTVPVWAYSSLRHAENLPVVNAGAAALFVVNVLAMVVVWLVARRDPDSLGWL